MRSGPTLTETTDPREVHKNIAVAIDVSRELYNGQPSQIAGFIDTLNVAAGARVVHIGCGTGYYTALLAHVAGPAGSVHAVDVDADLAARAGASLADLPWVTVAHGDGVTSLPADADVVFVHAGASHVRDEWLDLLRDGGRLLLPLACTMPGMSTTLSKGMVLLVTRHGGEWTATFSSMVMIYAMVGARDAAMNTALGQAFMRGGWDKVTRLRRDDHEPGPMCWLHTETNCLQMG